MRIKNRRIEQREPCDNSDKDIDNSWREFGGNTGKRHMKVQRTLGADNGNDWASWSATHCSRAIDAYDMHMSEDSLASDGLACHLSLQRSSLRS